MKYFNAYKCHREPPQIQYIRMFKVSMIIFYNRKIEAITIILRLRNIIY